MGLEYLNKGYFVLKSDVWSFAVLLWEIFSLGSLPYGMLEYNEVLDKLNNGYRLPFPNEILGTTINSAPSLLYTKIVDRCFVVDPEHRADFKEVSTVIETFLSFDELINDCLV